MKVSDRLIDADTVQKVVLGEILVLLRESMGWSATELCKIAEIDRDSYTKIEKGERNPTISSLVCVCNALNITLSDLFGEKYIELCSSKEEELRIDEVITEDFCRTVKKKKIISLLKRLRKSKGMSQTVISIKMDIPRTFINNLEYGRGKITPKLIKAIINVFDLSLDQFLELVEMN